MAVAGCVQCGNPAPVGAVTCPHCGAEHPHRSRAVRARAVTRRKRLVVAGVVGAVGLVVLLTVVTWPKDRPAACTEYDAARTQYESTVAAGADPNEESVTELREQVERLRAECHAAGG